MPSYSNRHVPGTSQALICLKAPTVVSDLDDGVSEYTASTVSPGSSVSSRSAHTSRRNKLPHHYREHGSKASSRSSNSGFYSPASGRSLASSNSSRTSYSGGPHSSTSSSSSTPSIYSVSFSSRKSHAVSSFSPSTSTTTRSSTSSKHHASSPSSPSYDSSLLAIYLASLRTQTPTAVHQFLLSNERFRDFRPHLSAMEDDAFRWFSDNVRSKNRDLVRGIESGSASSAVERVVRHVGQEWDEWMPRGRSGGCVDDGLELGLEREGRGRAGRGRPGLERRVSEVSYEEVWVQDGRTYRQRFSVTE